MDFSRPNDSKNGFLGDLIVRRLRDYISMHQYNYKANGPVKATTGVQHRGSDDPHHQTTSHDYRLLKMS